ncbi:predicted protein [Uncinocarpus reesii 1704]|uniref:SGT1 protein n=1 Tax=Uncinocarpus reesii (strain UAMH 1704) TaxID=336963 RepID=C4JLT2_UNCRE|nr:uncharacterized protein UREG_03790 [Uncinocarpus reesii 1704]EEP78944.1 predicted protein [Uncinocarpus reesii 1704]
MSSKLLYSWHLVWDWLTATRTSSRAADYYVKRSAAYLRLKPEDGGPNAEAALRDAEVAVLLGMKRARRESIIAAQLRRAIALYQLGRFGDADFLLEMLKDKLKIAEAVAKEKAAGVSLAALASQKGRGSNHQELQIWGMKAKSQLNKLEPEDKRAIVTVNEIPDVVLPEPEELKKWHQLELREMGVGVNRASVALEKIVASEEKPKVQETTTATNAMSSAEVKSNSQSPPTSSLPQHPISKKYRHEWYQNNDTVVVTLYAKGVPKDETKIDIQEHSLSITFPTSAGSDFTFDLDPLFGAIDPTASTSSIMSTKIEINLRKKQPGHKWGSLETTAVANTSSVMSPPRAFTTGKAPSYPTSARGGAKDWDKVAADLSKKNKSKVKDDGSKEEELDSDLDEYNSGDPVDAFFKKLYAGADDDTRRAMMKSYYESKGTALSTNWSEVGKGPVQEHPPTDD